MKVHYMSNSNEWETPQDLFDELDSKYRFTLDVCATKENAKCDRFFTIEDDGLSQEWGEGLNYFTYSRKWWNVCWMNPPYGREIGKWMEKAYKESLRGNTIVCLVPARTDTKWWHDYAIKGKITFIKGRLKFSNSKNSAPFPSAIVVF